jgi:hypothetical protein
MNKRQERKRSGPGRPPLPMPELPIPATPEELPKTIMQAPPKKEWRYLVEHETEADSQEGRGR